MTSLFRSTTLLLALVTTGLIAGCENYGTKLTFAKGEVYYTENVNEREAQRLGNFLLAQNYFDDVREKTVQVTKSGDTYKVRMVINQDSMKAHPEYEGMLAPLTGVISRDVFSGAPTDIELCDASLTTIKTFPYQKAEVATAPTFDPAALGTKIDVGEDSFYYTAAVDKTTAEKTANYLKEDGLFNGNGRVAQLDHNGNTWQLHVIFKEGSQYDSTIIEKMKRKAHQLSDELFEKAPVEIHLADDAMKTTAMASSAD